MSDYQPRPQGGWPTQPPASGGGQGGYGQGGYGQADQGYGPGSDDQATYGQQAGPPPRRRRRRHPLAWFLVVLVVLLVIAGVGDQIAKLYAQNDIAKQVQSAGLSAKPSVNIEGWPFLTQIAAHNVKTIDISGKNVTASGSKIPFSFTAKATGVHLNSSFNGATIDHINGQVTITYQSLDSFLGNSIGIPGLSAISISPNPAKGPNAVTASASGLASVDATVTKTAANQITIKFGKLGGLASLLGGAASIPDQVIDIPKLPLGLVVGSPEVTSQGIVIPASASNTTLTQ